MAISGLGRMKQSRVCAESIVGGGDGQRKAASKTEELKVALVWSTPKALSQKPSGECWSAWLPP